MRAIRRLGVWIAGGLIVAVVGLVGLHWATMQIAIDRCLDAGGRWLEASAHCDGARPRG